MDPKFFWTTNFFGPQIFWSQNVFGPKFFEPLFFRQHCFGPNFYGLKFFGYRFFLTKTTTAIAISTTLMGFDTIEINLVYIFFSFTNAF